MPSYDAIDILRATVERQHSPGAVFDALTTFGVTVSLLVVLGARAARGLALRFAPFLVLVLSQLLFALHTQRLAPLPSLRSSSLPSRDSGGCAPH